MNFNNIFKSLNPKGMFQGFGMKLVAARPELMLGGGGLLMLAGTIYACIKTDKAKEAVKNAKDELKDVDNRLKVIPDSNIDISPEERKQLKVQHGKELTSIYLRYAYQLIKIYGIPFLMWSSGMGLIIGSHGELRHINRQLAADILAGTHLMNEYRNRVATAVGEETEQKIFLGAQEGMVRVLEKDTETGEERIVEKSGDIFYAQPGSIFARNFTEETNDAFDIHTFAERSFEARVDSINRQLDIGMARAFNGMDILRMLGFNENALGDDASVDKLLNYGISGNARKVPDPEMRHLKVTRLSGYQKRWDAIRNMEIYVPCIRFDFNFYPLEGKI